MSGEQSQKTLAELFADFRQATCCDENIYGGMLKLLEHDERSKQAWEKWLRHPGRDEQYGRSKEEVFGSILASVVSIKYHCNEYEKFFREAMEEHEYFTKMAHSADNLLEWYRKELNWLKWFETLENSLGKSYVIEVREIHKTLIALENILIHAKEKVNLCNKRIEIGSYKSQKFTPQRHFQIALCKRCELLVGTPCYAFVADMTNILFEFGEQISEDAVRKLWTREKQRRNTAMTNGTAPDDFGVKTG